MCMSGGNEATREARRAEERRTRDIGVGTAAVNEAFGARQPQYDQFINTLRDHFRTDAERQKSVADRQLRFSLARGGLTGGSAQRDAGENLGREFSQGLLEAERRAQGGLADLQARDEQTRMNLLSMVQGGMNATAAAQQAGHSMRSNIAGAQGANLVGGLGDIFGGTANLYERQQAAAQRRRGLAEAEKYSNPFSRSGP